MGMPLNDVDTRRVELCKLFTDDIILEGYCIYDDCDLLHFKMKNHN